MEEKQIKYIKQSVITLLIACLISGCTTPCLLLPRQAFESHIDDPRQQIENPNIYIFEVRSTDCPDDYDKIIREKAEKILTEKHYDSYSISSYTTTGGITYMGSTYTRVYTVEFVGDNTLEPIRMPGDCTGTWDEIKDCF